MSDAIDNLRKEFEHQGLPDYMLNAVERYVTHGQRTGDFLFALLRNDATTTICKADATNLALLRPWCWFLLHGLPSDSYGSASNVKAWMAHNGLEGKP